jgi:hypothetical protein
VCGNLTGHSLDKMAGVKVGRKVKNRNDGRIWGESRLRSMTLSLSCSERDVPFGQSRLLVTLFDEGVVALMGAKSRAASSGLWCRANFVNVEIRRPPGCQYLTDSIA